MTPETHSRISILRAKAEAGSATKEDYIEAIRLLREDRMSAGERAASTSTSRTKKAKAEIKSADEMLDELGEG